VKSGCNFTMISGKAVDDCQVLPQSTLILASRKARTDFALLRAKRFKVINGQKQMMWCHLACHWQTHQFGTLDYFNLSRKYRRDFYVIHKIPHQKTVT